MRNLIPTVVFILCLQGYGIPKVEAAQGYNLTFKLSAIHLPTQDDLSAADAFVKLYSYTSRNGSATPPEDELELTRFGTTDRTYNTENPEWSQVFWFWYEAGTGQKFFFKVVDHDVMNYDDEIGKTHVNVDELVSHKGNFYANLSAGGSLIIKKTQPITFRIKASNVPAKDRMWGYNGLSDPYVECYYRKTGSNEENLFHTTPVISDVENPVWPEPIEFGHYQPGRFQTMYFKVYDHDAFSADDFIGDALVAVDDLTKRRGSTTIELQRATGRPSLTLEMI